MSNQGLRHTHDIAPLESGPLVMDIRDIDDDGHETVIQTTISPIPMEQFRNDYPGRMHFGRLWLKANPVICLRRAAKARRAENRAAWDNLMESFENPPLGVEKHRQVSNRISIMWDAADYRGGTGYYAKDIATREMLWARLGKRVAVAAGAGLLLVGGVKFGPGLVGGPEDAQASKVETGSGQMAAWATTASGTVSCSTETGMPAYLEAGDLADPVNGLLAAMERAAGTEDFSYTSSMPADLATAFVTQVKTSNEDYAQAHKLSLPDWTVEGTQFSVPGPCEYTPPAAG